MGIFEKAIPKYIHNHENEVVVEPQQSASTLPPEPYIDDIFDPLFNRSVRNYLNAKYDSGISSTFEGYSELLNNTWNGNKGIFGKGMGLLSTFGRSMEKADDLILGGLTEGVKGFTGQGFENPIKNIFVEDEDYSGRRLLAAMANSMRGFAGGTTVDESDFGGAWTLPSLGIELVTDVGILGGSVARKFAPAAKDLTSREILRNIGKNDAAGTLGEVGQLLSNYDDLMARVAIDVSAPGLRPAFKALRNKLAQLFQTYGYENIANVVKHRQNPSSPPPEDAEAAAAVAQLIDDVTGTMDSIPVSEAEAVLDANKTAAQLAQEAIDDEAYTMYEYIRETVRSKPYKKFGKKVRKYSYDQTKALADVFKKHSETQASAISETVRRLQASNIPLDSVGIERVNSDAAKTLDEIRKDVLANIDSIDDRYVDEILDKLDYPDEDFLDVIDSATWSVNESANAFLDNLVHGKWRDALDIIYGTPKYSVSPSILKLLEDAGVKGTSLAHARLDAVRYRFRDLDSPRFTSLEELDEYLKSPKMAYALREYFPTFHRVRDWDPNDAMVREFMLNPDNFIGDNVVPVKVFSNGEYRIVLKPKYADYTRRIRDAIKDVYFPKDGTDVPKYTTALERLSLILDKSNIASKHDELLKAAPDEGMFLEELYRAFDGYARLKTGDTGYFGIDQAYLQPLRGEFPHPKGNEKTSNPIIGKSGEILGFYESSKKGLSEDFSMSPKKYVQSILAQVAPYVKSDEDLAYFIEPILEYYQISPRKFSKAKFDNLRKTMAEASGWPEHLFPVDNVIQAISKDRLTPSESTLKLVEAFKTDTLPKIKNFVARGGNPYSYKKVGNVTQDEHREIRALLGYVDITKFGAAARRSGGFIASTTFMPNNGYANRLMLQSVWDGRNFKSVGKAEQIALEDAAMRANLSQKVIEQPKLSFDTVLADSLKNLQKTKITSDSVTKTSEMLKEAVVEQPAEQVAKQAYETTTPATVTVEKVASELAPRVDSFIQNGGSEEAAKHIFGEEEWNLWKKVQEAAAVPARNAKGDKATLRAKGNVELAKRFEALISRVSEPYKKFKRYYILQSERLGDTLAGREFWKEFRSSSMFTSGYSKGHFMIKKTQDALTRNANIINRILGGDYVEVVVHNVHNKQGTVAVTMRWNTKHSDVVDAIRKHRSELERANFEDIVFAQPRALTQSELEFLNSDDMRELDELMRELQFRAADQARTLGFVYDTSKPYTRHAMSHSPDTAQYLNDNFYVRTYAVHPEKDGWIQNLSAELDDISAHISDLYGDKGVFGSREVARRFRGSYWNLENPSSPIFEYMPDRVFKSTLADGMFANNQYQSFVDLFHNDSFKISEWFKSVDDLKEVLYAKHPDGSLSGNLQNLELVTFRTNAEGRLVGLTKFDKMSDAGLEAALKNPDTILVPAGAVTHMDKLLRKDVRMGNKFWAFVNKHLTIPFKFGLLANPGFLLGNIGDATLKLTTTMSEKYGTTMAEEAQRTAESIATVMNTRSMYYDAFQKFLEDCEINNVPLGPEEMIPDIVAMSPKRKERFLKYLNGELTVKVKGSKEPLTVVPTLTKQQEEACRFWFMLQEMQMSSNKLREYEDLAELSHKSRFDVPGNMFDRITQGSGQYDPKNFRTWGAFMNNPVMNTFTDSSESWEELIRTASIIDDLRHRGYGAETFGKQLNPDELLEFDVAKVDAKNTMYNAQFDYERTNDFIDKVGKAVPFPIFFLKNFQYWMDLWMRNPQWVDDAIDVQEGLWAGRREEDEDDTFAIEAKGRGAIPVGGDSLPDWFKGIYKPAPLQSMFGAFSLLNSPLSDLSYRRHPLIGGATAALSNISDNELTTLLSNPEDVKYRPYSTDMYERNIKATDPNFNPLEYTVHRMNPFERAVNTYLRTPSKVEKGEAQLSDFLPSIFQPDF